MRYWKQAPSTLATSADDFDLAVLEPAAGWEELTEAEHAAAGSVLSDRQNVPIPDSPSFFRLKARGDGTLAVTKIVATLDYGTENDITSFIAEHADEPAIAGGQADWQASGLITLTLDDPDEKRQQVMQGFLYLCMMSGRFTVTPNVQALIFT